jgi:hypothetical protein
MTAPPEGTKQTMAQIVHQSRINWTTEETSKIRSKIMKKIKGKCTRKAFENRCRDRGHISRPELLSSGAFRRVTALATARRLEAIVEVSPLGVSVVSRGLEVGERGGSIVAGEFD